MIITAGKSLVTNEAIMNSYTSHLGHASLPCNINAPMANQRALRILNLFSVAAPVDVSHSKGLNLLTRNSPILTHK